MRQCKMCGATFLSGETTCTYCGNPLVAGAERKRPQQKRPPNEAHPNDQWDFSAFTDEFRAHQSAGPPPLNMFRQNRVDRVIAAVLAFTLGTFGAHWFYLGRPGRAVWYAIFFWTGIPTIIGIVEGVYLLRDSI